MRGGDAGSGGEDRGALRGGVQGEGGCAVRGVGYFVRKKESGTSPDIFLAADPSYTEEAAKKGLIAETMPVCLLKAGIAVEKGNPKNVNTLEDLLREDVRVGIGNPEAASIGQFTQEVLGKAGIWSRLEPKLSVKLPTVNEIANAAKMRTVDAAIIWDGVAAQYPELDFVHVPEFDAEPKTVTVAVTTATGKATEALRFSRYLTARDRGLEIFRDNKYEPVEGDRWALRPELTFFSGAMLKPAIEGALARFQEREGVTIHTVFNGCGILVLRWRAARIRTPIFLATFRSWRWWPTGSGRRRRYLRMRW